MAETQDCCRSSRKRGNSRFECPMLNKRFEIRVASDICILSSLSHRLCRYHLLFHCLPFHNRPHRGRVQMRVSVMEMVLLDWTRMGRSFCVAGALFQDTHYRLVRPLLAKNRQAPVRNVGWSAYL